MILLFERLHSILRPPTVCLPPSTFILFINSNMLTALQLKGARLLVHGILGQIHVARHGGGDPTDTNKRALAIVAGEQ